MRRPHPSASGRSRRTRRLLCLAVVGALLSACGGSGQAAEVDAAPTAAGDDDGGPTVVTTTTILGDVVSQVVGDGGEVVTLMPPGADPHTFQASAQQLTRMQDADLLVVNGANLEESLEAALQEVESAGVPILRATDHVDTLSYEDGHGHADDDDEHAEDDAAHDERSVDPHFWMDPTRMADAVTALGERLVEVTGDEASAQRAGEYARQLSELDQELESMLERVPSEARVLVTNHDSFAYFADRYDFEVAGTVIPSVSTGAEPSAQDLERLAETIRREDVPAIFTETTQTDQLARTLAAEVGAQVQVVPLHTGSLDAEGSGPGSYVDMLRSNAERIAEALAG